MKTLLYSNKRCLSAAKALVLVLLSISGFFNAQAQVSFRNPTLASGAGASSEFTVYNSPVDDSNQAVQVPAPGDGELTVDFSATLFRPVGTPTQGYVALHLGTASNALVTPDITAAERPTVDNSLWTPALDINGVASSSYEQLIVTGTFTISGDVVANNTKLYAVYYTNGVAAAISNPVLLRILPPDPEKNPIVYYLPCGGDVICGDQCLPYGARPKRILGRVLATQRGGSIPVSQWFGITVYNDYSNICARKGISVWASDDNDEEVIWQNSYDGVNWTDITASSTMTPSYQPPACTRTTYYRRVSTHFASDWWDWLYGERRWNWYTSNVVTITPIAPIPTTAQPSVKSCGSAVTVSANANTAIASYNWWVPYAGWTISDGSQAPFSTFNSNSSFVTSRNTNIVIYPVSNVAPGDYEISFSANGGCGGQSPDGHLTVTVDYTPTRAPINGYFVLNEGSNPCFQRYHLRTSPVAGATSYEAILSTGQSATGHFDQSSGEIQFFSITGPVYGISAQIFARGACGLSTAYDVPVQDLDYLRPAKGAARIPTPCKDAIAYSKAYPNPAADFITIQAQSDASIGYLYNNQGKLLRTITLDKGNVNKVLDTSKLPDGLYNLIIESPTHERYLEHIAIEH